MKDGVRSFFVDGRKVHEERLPDAPDPWLALVADADTDGTARALTIDGSPAIPETLDLSAESDLTGWRADEYDEVIGPTGASAWEKRGEEIVGNAYAAEALRTSTGGEETPVLAGGPRAARRPAYGLPGTDQESVLRYHRPMLEDGTFAYEFYHDPGKAEVHPALGRFAYRIDADGVTARALSDAPYGPAPAPPVADPDSRRGPERPPLKPGDWNRLELALEGDTLSLRLNGVEVYRKAVEPGGDRSFGLFHLADRAPARVRKVTYRGAWPRTLPPAEAVAGSAPAP
ncbi:MAG: DUF1583 domain-containing protein [Thermoleophilia bacterium]|nr:DUF1583 domain-containing protein [Thermoleophilia bacterium]